MKTLLYIALGGALGAVLRYLLGLATLQYGEAFPWGTLIVNVTGSIILGIVSALMLHSWTPTMEFRSFLVVGLLGGFTTFSAFSFEAALFFERERFDMAFLYIGGTVLLSIGGLYAGLRAARTFLT